MSTSSTRDRPGGAGPQSPQNGFRHAAVFYGDEDEFLAGTAPIVRDALDADEAVLVALPAGNAQSLRAELGDDAERVGFVEIESVGANPARIIPVWREFVEANVVADRPALGIGEPVWPERSADELIECQHHESLINLAFREDPAWALLCPYDTGALDDDVLEEARRTHPILAEGQVERPSAAFTPDPDGRPYSGPLADAPADAEAIAFGTAGTGAIREFVRVRAAGAGLDEERSADFALAVNELTANSIRHGGGGGELRLWKQEGRLVCEVRDAGTIEGPLLGRVRPDPDWIGGRGLWLVNQLCDLLQVRALPEGNLARVQMRIDAG